jgi:hypothetical protein
MARVCVYRVPRQKEKGGRNDSFHALGVPQHHHDIREIRSDDPQLATHVRPIMPLLPLNTI